MKFIVFFLISVSVISSEINLLRSHRTLQNQNIQNVHREVARETNTELECIMAISYSYNEFTKASLVKLVQQYNDIVIKDKMEKIKILMLSKLPASYLFKYLSREKGLSQLEIIKIYEKVNDSFLVVSSEIINGKDYSSIDEIDSDNIFINKNSTLSDFVSYAYKHFNLVPEKKSLNQLDESIHYFSSSFDKLENANDFINSQLNLEMKNHQQMTSNKARELASQKNYGVILFLSDADKVIGGVSFNSETGEFIKLILI